MTQTDSVKTAERTALSAEQVWHHAHPQVGSAADRVVSLGMGARRGFFTSQTSGARCFTYAFGADVAFRASPERDHFTVSTVLSGVRSMETRSRRTVMAPGAVWVSNREGEALIRHSAECVHLILCVDPKIVERELTAMLGAPTRRPLIFDPDRSALPSQRIMQMLKLAASSSGEMAGETDRIMAHLQAMIATALLCEVPHSHAGAMRARSGEVGPEYLARAEEYIRENLTEPISLGELAEAAGCSVRALHKAFGRYREVSPMSWVKARRLEEARRELLDPESKCATVAQVAMQVAMFHLGNFAGDYRRQFGEMPSETIRRRNRTLN